MLKSICSILIALLLNSFVYAQDIHLKKKQGGLFSLGVRSTVNLFSGKNSKFHGLGWGGQFRLQLSDHINTEWFFDYMRGNIAHKASRTDFHVGWSVMYYFSKKLAPPVKPYLVVGHCFDRSKLVDNSNRSNKIFRNSSAIQAGAGVQFNLSKRFDITLLTQYMFHLGKDIHAHIKNDEVTFERHKGTGIEGHLLLTVSINYKIADLWAGKKNKNRRK